jgi:FKBP-type peptidyl-prolyl cis-trans isomerase
MNRTKSAPSTPVFLILTALLALPLALVPAAAQDDAMQEESTGTMAAAEPAAPSAPENLTPPAGAETTASGLAYEVLSEGTGTERADGNDLAVVHYTGWVSDTGEVFATSTTGAPQLLPLEALIEGWTEGLQLMPEGATWRLWIPGELAYQGVEGRPQGMLVFDVELLDVRHIPDVPADLAAAPADAETGRNGLAWKVLADGTGTGSPGPGDTVKVHYIGWKLGQNGEGQWFDSSYGKGAPAVLEFDTLIDGWKQALRDMVPGEKRRLWVPGSLAYADDPSGPQGMLVFEVELLEVNPAPEEDAG